MNRTKWSLALTAHPDMVDEAIRLVLYPRPRQRMANLHDSVRDCVEIARWFRHRADGIRPAQRVQA
jgi:hypothetical protein